MAICLGAGGVGWASATVLTPAGEVLDATPFTYVSVERGEVSSTLSLNSVGAWEPFPLATNQATGVVTSVVAGPGDEVTQGSVLYAVDLRPVVVAQGEVPAFRPIVAGSEGADVAQLQAMLKADGVYSGRVDGRAGAGTVGAIRRWQKARGVSQTGVVEYGDVVFVPSLPVRVALDDEIVFRGAMLTGGEKVLRGLPAAPTFRIPVTDSQAAMMPEGTHVEIVSPEGGLWPARTAGRRTDTESGTITVALEGEDGGVVCGAACGQVPTVGEALLASKIVIVPVTRGLVVPSAALLTDARGHTAVVTADGARAPVEIVASARGMSVIEGIAEGARVRIPAKEKS